MLVDRLEAVEGDVDHVVAVLQHAQVDDDEGIAFLLVAAQRSTIIERVVKC